MESFKQGYRLQREDLNAYFWSTQLLQPYPIDFSNRIFPILPDEQFQARALPYYPMWPSLFSPYWVRYGLGYVDSHGHYHEFGARYRLPDELSAGVYRPKFIVEADWAVGTYRIRWKYQVFEGNDIRFMDVQFEVTTAGIYDQPGDFPDYRELPADMVVIS